MLFLLILKTVKLMNHNRLYFTNKLDLRRNKTISVHIQICPYTIRGKI